MPVCLYVCVCDECVWVSCCLVHDGGSPNGTIVGTLSAFDPENDTLVYAVVNRGSSPFVVLSNGSIMYMSTLGAVDYETTNTYSLTGSCREASTPDLFFAATNVVVTIAVLDVKEAALLLAASHNISISESVGVSAVDDTFTPTLVDGAIQWGPPDANDWDYVVQVPNVTVLMLGPSPFVVFPNGSILVVSRLNFEAQSLYRVAVRVIDSVGAAVNDTVAVTVLQAHDRPVLTCGAAGSQSCPVQYDETFVGVVDLGVSAVDEDPGDVLSVSVVSRSSPALSFDIRTAGSSFAVMNVSGWIPPGQYWVVVRATDASGGLSVGVCNVSITIVDVNDPPSFVGGSTLTASVSELSVASTPVLTLVGYDRDALQVLTFSVVSVVSGSDVLPTTLFTVSYVNNRSSVLSIAEPVLDFEVVSSYVVTLRVQDDGLHVVNRGSAALSAQAVLTLSVVDAADTPVVTWVRGGKASDVMALQWLGSSATAQQGVGKAWLDTMGGDALVVGGLYLGSPTPGGLNASRGSLEVWYWDGRADGTPSASHRFYTSSCEVVGYANASWYGVMSCGTVAGYGVVTSLQVSVSGVRSAVFNVSAASSLSYQRPVVTVVTPAVLMTSGGQVCMGWWECMSSWCLAVVLCGVPLACSTMRFAYGMIM